MTGAFDDINITWGDKVHRLKARGPNGRMMAGAKIESVITLSELAAFQARGATPHVTICRAYGQLLRHVGATATDDEVLDWLGEAADGDEVGDRIRLMVETICTVLTPGKLLKTSDAGRGGSPENPPSGSSKAASG